MSELETLETTQESQAPPQGVPVEQSIEDKARATGWKPPDEFKGEQTRYTDAETWVANGNEKIPLLQADKEKLYANNAELNETISALRSEVAENRQATKEFVEHQKRVTETEKKRSYDQAMSDFDQEEVTAVEDQDVDTYKAVRAKREKVQADYRPEPKQQQQQQADPAFDDWKSKNQWYDKDKMLRADANAMGETLGKDGLPRSEILEIVGQEIRQKYAHKFDNPNRRAPTTMDAERVNSVPKKHSYENLPAEARAVCDRGVREGTISKEDYVNYYPWDE